MYKRQVLGEARVLTLKQELEGLRGDVLELRAEAEGLRRKKKTKKKRNNSKATSAAMKDAAGQDEARSFAELEENEKWLCGVLERVQMINEDLRSVSKAFKEATDAEKAGVIDVLARGAVVPKPEVVEHLMRLGRVDGAAEHVARVYSM